MEDDTEDEEDTKINTESIGLSMYRLLVSDNFRKTLFSNTIIVFRIYLRRCYQTVLVNGHSLDLIIEELSSSIMPNTGVTKQPCLH